MKIPFLRPGITESDLRSLCKSIRSGWLSFGPETKKFERVLAKYLGAKEAVFTNSATAALHLSLILAGVEEGDEVITTPLTYVATSNVILYQRAKPVFVDVDPETGLMDLDQIEIKITNKTKAVLPVHLYGQMVDMKKLKKIADKHNLKIVEDSAHALESQRDGVRPGKLSLTTCHSFHAAKNITSGQGGAMVLNDYKMAERARGLRRDGVININDDRQMVEFGYKYDAADFQAAVLFGQLKRIKQTHAQRVRVIKRYANAFDRAGISYPRLLPNTIHSGHMFVVWVDPQKRDDIRRQLKKKGVQTSIHYHPVHLETYYRKAFSYKEGDFPIAEKLGSMTITLPTYAGLTAREQDYVINTLIKIVRKK